MASVNSATSTGSTSSFFNNKITGLASGMDTETMIENMTASTRSKIAKQQQKKQLLNWKTETMRSISDLLVSFKNKYTSFTSPATNLLSSSFFSRNQITTIGTNSKYVKATGTSNSADSLSILGVKQLASSASMNIAAASDRVMETGEFDLNGEAKVSSIAGTSMRVKFGEKSYTISFSSGTEFNTMEDVAKAINEQFDAKEIKVNASVDTNGALTFESDEGYKGNAFEITSGTGDILKTLGIAEKAKLDSKTTKITGNSYKDSEGLNNDSRLKKEMNTKDILSGQTISFSYNGTTKKITLPERTDKKDELKDYMDNNPGKYANEFEALRGWVQEKVDKEFGKNKITVGATNVNGSKGKLTFETKDATSVLKVVSSGSNVLGQNGVLGMNYGESNRVNTTVALKDSGLTGAKGLAASTTYIKIPKLDAKGNEVKDKDGNVQYEYEGKGFEFTINGEKFQFKENENLANIINKINKSDAGVTMSYNETSDSFTIKANNSGSGGEIDIEDVNGNMAATLFGVKAKADTSAVQSGNITIDGKQQKGIEFSIAGENFQFSENTSFETIKNTINNNATLQSKGIEIVEDTASGTYKLVNPSGEDVTDNVGNFGEKLLEGFKSKEGYSKGLAFSDFKAGQDAIVNVDFGDGAGPIEIVRDSNSFNLDGMDITVSGKFGTYKADGTIDVDASEEDAVSFEANVDSDKAVEAVKSMVDDYNALIELVNKELTTKRDRDYEPLTDEQKKDMTENEIKLWEEKAKAGMLFGDSDLRALSDELAMIFTNTDIQAFENAGITMSSDWAENGKLSFDEEKFRAAVEADPEAISKLFTSEKNAGDAFDGAMTSMNNLCEKYAKTTGATKGILIERAGNKAAPLSLMKNDYLTQMNEIDALIKTLNEKLKSERTRYNNQFTDLEVLMSKMSSQSSWLTQQFAG